MLVVLFWVLATLFTPKLKTGFEAESAEVLAVVTDATVEVAVARAGKREAVVGLKGADMGIDVGGPGLSKMSSKVGVAAVERVALEETVAAMGALDAKSPSLSTLAGGSKMGLNMGEAEHRVAAVVAGLGGAGLGLSNGTLCVGAGAGPGVGGGVLAGISA